MRLLVGAACGTLLLTGCTGPQSEPSADTRTAGLGFGRARRRVRPRPPRRPRPRRRRRGRPEATELLGGLTTPWGLVALKNGSLLISERDTKQILLVDGRREGLAADDRRGPARGRGRAARAGRHAGRAAGVRVLHRRRRQPDRGDELRRPDPGRAAGDPGRHPQGPDPQRRPDRGRPGRQPLRRHRRLAPTSQLAQDRESLGGKILRITLDGKPAPGNPFGNEVFSLGHRNVQGLAFDEQDRLWACEFGSQELGRAEPDRATGNNYGWPLVEGSGEGDGLTNPKVVWGTDEASPSGLAYWQGELWMAGLRGERLWEIPVDGTDTGEPVGHFEGDYGRLRTRGRRQRRPEPAADRVEHRRARRRARTATTGCCRSADDQRLWSAWPWSRCSVCCSPARA